MAAGLHKLTISVTPDMEADLNAVKRECYYKGTQNDMITDLIRRGLQAAETEQVCRQTKELVKML